MTTKKGSKVMTKAVGDGAKGQKRRYVRLEIFSPVGFAAIVVEDGKRVRLHPDKKAGVLLNLSGGGALISSTDQATSGELVLMKFDIKGFDALTNVLGRVKRVEEQDDGERLIGIEFLSPEQLGDPVLETALTRLTEHPKDFADGLSRLISRYVFARQVEAEKE
ncbi:MAG: PilZ domain-containing protein [candidate division Zixibacteria bacterium]|nr:PilZ domain-containing protein [candidate division Zixibacteria bacterium]